MLMAVPINPGVRGIPFGTPEPLFTVPTTGIDRGYAVAADGQRFLLPTIAAASASPPPITVVTNWTPAQ